MMNPATDSDERVLKSARAFKYPATPDVSRAVRARLAGSPPSGQESQARQVLFMSWRSLRNLASSLAPTARAGVAVKNLPLMKILRVAAVTLIVAMIVLFAIPQTRAALVGWFQVGVVRILPTAPPTSTILPEQLLPVTATPSLPITALTDSLPEPLRKLGGLTTLENLQGYSLFKLKLPAYPANLGAPDFVFDQKMIPMVVFAWRDPADPQGLLMSLYEIAPGSPIVTKIEPKIIEETTVNGQYALWVEGDYLLQLTNGNFDLRRTVSGYTLVWEQDGITYRLETNLSLAEARKIAESLR